ncbi:dephospho-CoA kinase [Sediminibacterium sp.]|jgi:dephospho-CoA kinase|uniref:dephospho-CoA kinase n=1 Tax=Sediminibacterium sp. TaxID=1917865 RepID=UPI0026000151|nr:dephospho-CoA kinase [Sediminibacterium sp.]MBW0178203.1 dephospho-CoA kinase [Sediminibacterium sp.]
MLKIGLTGGIGSGKSTVAGIFRVLGIPVFDADANTRSLMETDSELQTGILSLFGDKAYEDGKLNRKWIADIVFNDPFQLEKLNALVHPATIAAAESWADRQTASYVIKEAALFFEAGSSEGMDYIIGVYAPQHLRINRVMKRDGVSREEVLSRMNKQIQEEIKMRLCDFVILNDDQHLVIPQVLQLHEKFLDEAKEINHG